jgi:hypothetical protein
MRKIKKNPKRTVAHQLEFNFCDDGSLIAPPAEVKITCCSNIPKQYDHPEFHASCFADEMKCRRPTPGGWPRPDFRPVISTRKSTDPKTPKAAESDPTLLLLQERKKVDGEVYNPNIGQTVQTCKPALSQGRAVGLPASQSATLDQRTEGNHYPTVSLPAVQDTETGGSGGIRPGSIIGPSER